MMNYSLAIMLLASAVPMHAADAKSPLAELRAAANPLSIFDFSKYVPNSKEGIVLRSEHVYMHGMIERYPIVVHLNERNNRSNRLLVGTNGNQLRPMTDGEMMTLRQTLVGLLNQTGGFDRQLYWTVLETIGFLTELDLSQFTFERAYRWDHNAVWMTGRVPIAAGVVPDTAIRIQVSKSPLHLNALIVSNFLDERPMTAKERLGLSQALQAHIERNPGAPEELREVYRLSLKVVSSAGSGARRR